jgi:hypothetical protein
MSLYVTGSWRDVESVRRQLISVGETCVMHLSKYEIYELCCKAFDSALLRASHIQGMNWPLAPSPDPERHLEKHPDTSCARQEAPNINQYILL